MKYKFCCHDCGYGVEEGFFSTEDEAEHEALTHLAQDHGYRITAFYSANESDYAYERR